MITSINEGGVVLSPDLAIRCGEHAQGWDLLILCDLKGEITSRLTMNQKETRLKERELKTWGEQYMNN